MSDDNNGCVSGIVLILFLAGSLLFSVIFGWTDVPGATKALQAENLTPIHVGGVSWFSCSDDDWYATKFTAKNLHGDIISGTVCSGLFFKGTTVRFDN